ncbi:MAG: hypothetical protein K0Q78_2021 [Cellvibrio sp.]|nr:hypothetical protein [Cellvibrio sp.]
MTLLHRLKIMLGSLLIIGCTSINASEHHHSEHPDKNKKNCVSATAPATLIGVDVVLRIEKAVTGYPNGFPFKGAVVKRFKRDGTFTALATSTQQGQAPDAPQTFYGTYKYQRTGFNTAIEKSIDVSVNNTPYTTKYTFETATSGKWEEDFGNGQIIFSGSFTLEPSNAPAQEHLAPATNAGLNVVLFITDATSATLPPDVYPKKGIALQTYAQDGNFLIKGYGPLTLDSHGTYSYKKISANTAVEEANQISPFFTQPYTMVYTFDTPTSGTWYQSLGNDWIKFSGTFVTSPN